jgi:polyhydroxybutyrate depolymerase
MNHPLIRHDLIALLTLAALTGCVPESGPEGSGDPDPFELDEDFDLGGGGGEADAGGEDAGGPDDEDAGGVVEEDAGGPDELDAGEPDAEDAGGEPGLDAPLGGTRPARVTLPAGYDNSREVPLVIALHGFGGTDESVGRYFSLERNVDDRDFILVSPQGTTNAFGSTFWNATPACCDGFDTGIDDAGYIRGLIEEAFGRFNVDEGRVYVAGYSNGGFMSYRMACDSADYVTGIFVLAGGTYKDPTLCQPSRPVQILHLHGTADETIAYDGGSALAGVLPEHPGAVETVTNWATYNGCDPTPVGVDAAAVDAVTVEDAAVTSFEGCPAGGAVELWTLPDAPHNPGLPRTLGTYVLDRFFAIDRTP